MEIGNSDMTSDPIGTSTKKGERKRVSRGNCHPGKYFFFNIDFYMRAQKHFSRRSSVICDDEEILMPDISSGDSRGKENVSCSRQDGAQKEE